jgi:uncharacterized protein
MRLLLVICCFLAQTGQNLQAQPMGYLDSLKKFRQDYVETHALVAKQDKKRFRFFPIQQKLAIHCRFERLADSVGFTMKTSGNQGSKYFRYGKLFFLINNQAQQLTLFQSADLMNQPQYADYLFVPFTDATTGKQTYGGGRYIDLRLGDIQNNTLVLDFNKAYNPYCAYASGFACPIPPRENHLPVAITAGEKTWPEHFPN